MKDYVMNRPPFQTDKDEPSTDHDADSEINFDGASLLGLIDVQSLRDLVHEAMLDVQPAMIGWDCCVLAVRVIHERLKRLGIESEPLGCHVIAYHASDPTTHVALGKNDRHGHAVIRIGRCIIDPTIAQLKYKLKAIDTLPTLFFDLPDNKRCAFSGDMAIDGVHIQYQFDRSEPPYFLDSIDWKVDFDTWEQCAKNVRRIFNN